jgi:hypothetical protein
LLEQKEEKLAESEENLRRLKVELAKVKKHENTANNGDN